MGNGADVVVSDGKQAELGQKETLSCVVKIKEIQRREALMSSKVTIELTKDEAFVLLEFLARHVYDGGALAVVDQREDGALRSLCEALDDELVEQFRSEYKDFTQSRVKGSSSAS